MTKFTILTGTLRHILFGFAAILYLLFSPSLYYQLFAREGKPVEVWDLPPEVTGNITFHIEGLAYWSENIVVYEENETYALGGWGFVNTGPDTKQADFERFVVVYNDLHAYLFSVRDYPRPGVQSLFKDVGLSDLTSSGFNAVISRNALAVGQYKVGLLFRHKQNGSIHFVQAITLIERTPNHLLIKSTQ